VAAPDIDNVKTNVKQKIAGSLDNYFQNTSEQIIASIDTYITQLRELLKSEIDGCLLKYKDEINRQVTAEEATAVVIQENIDKFEHSINKINDKREKINMIAKQLSWMQKKDTDSDTEINSDLWQLESEEVKNITIESEILISNLEQLINQMKELDKYISELP